jgi:pyridoxal phosphate enzyme (YggS family)
MIQDNIQRILGRIESLCSRIGRDPQDITCIAVTKFADVSAIKAAVEAGLTHVGENKVQEALKKFPELERSGLKVTRHMIGHLQTNKVKSALESFDMIQSVDSVRLAEEIELQAMKLGKTIDILVQVNTAEEPQKFGAAPAETGALIKRIVELKHVRLKGLMAIAPFTESQEVVRKCFRNLREIRDVIAQQYVGDDRVEMKYLSMGMTDDFEIALEEGSNMVRIGRAIFSD